MQDYRGAISVNYLKANPTGLQRERAPREVGGLGWAVNVIEEGGGILAEKEFNLGKIKVHGVWEAKNSGACIDVVLM